jgi:hypothetical protein
MSDSPSARGIQDRLRISVTQRHELQWWSQRFGVTVEQLREALVAVGPQAADVEEYLLANGKKDLKRGYM